MAFVCEYLDTSFRSARDAEAYLGLPVLAVIPRVLEKRQRFWRRMDQIAAVCSVAVAIVLFCAFAALAFKGVEPTLELVRGFTRMP